MSNHRQSHSEILAEVESPTVCVCYVCVLCVCVCVCVYVCMCVCVCVSYLEKEKGQDGVTEGGCDRGDIGVGAQR